MNTAWSAQSVTGSQTRKRNFRETSHKTHRRLREDRLKAKGADREVRECIEERVRKRVTAEPEACDMLLSLFSSALFCYRRASICEPFPDEFTIQGEKKYEEVELYTKALPDIQHFNQNQYALRNLPLPALKLLAWIVDTDFCDEFEVEQVSLEQYKQETKGIDSKQTKYSDPNYIFKIKYSMDHVHAQDFEVLKEKYGSNMGFHGSGFENFHSILRNGLDTTFGKETSLYGDGIYLSEDRDVAYGFLKSGKNWSANSIFGGQVGCIVCAEVARHPQGARFSSEKGSSGGITIADDDSKLPKGYIVVEDNEYVLVRYILLYKDFYGNIKKKSNVCQFIALFYILLLVGLWLMRSAAVKHYYSLYSSWW